eukprot:CAMPEP_0177652288 /NCGR_PEP_ID=MMETSP0447-20121125/13039_1 /TAXON_ID=0 /ORGANISM="Stygamoeba regulata, Strain BSH-02190019" /LENGTH=703 /DNA_ID=CAMNT_0019155501 /DNA_START=31 /DNA_END=2142 /DNA_ORIENTATION=+
MHSVSEGVSKLSIVVVAFLLLSSLLFSVPLPVSAGVLDKDVDDAAYLANKVYDLVSASHCVRLLGNSGPIGCATSKHGADGTLLYLGSLQEAEYFLEHPSSSTVITALAASLFNKTLIHSLVDTGSVSGVIVVEDGSQDALAFSPAARYPNHQYGLYPRLSYVWNPDGDDWTFSEVRVPISSITLEVAQKHDIINKARGNWDADTSDPDWAAQLNAFMYSGAYDAETCLRRKVCEPVGGQSVYSYLSAPRPQVPLILASSTMDSFAFFQDLAVGADASTSSFIALLAAARTLAISVPDLATLPKQLFFAFFTGEVFGYQGSKRFLADITSFHCNDLRNGTSKPHCQDPYRSSLQFQDIRFEEIAMVLDVSQVAHSQDRTFFMHRDSDTATSAEMIKVMQRMGEEVDLNMEIVNVDSRKGLPPSTLQAFLLKDRTLPGVVLTEHRDQYVNRHYQSRLDRRSGIDIQVVADFATMLARSLYSLAGGDPRKYNITVDTDFVDQLFLCMTEDFKCPLIAEVLPATRGKPLASPPTHYTSIYRRTNTISLTSGFLQTLLTNLTATPSLQSCTSNSECTLPNQQCADGRCFTSFAYYHPSYSTGLEYDVDERMWIVVDSTQAIYAESYWENPSLLIFQRETLGQDMAIISMGILQTTAVLLIILGTQRYLKQRRERLTRLHSLQIRPALARSQTSTTAAAESNVRQRRT